MKLLSYFVHNSIKCFFIEIFRSSVYILVKTLQFYLFMPLWDYVSQHTCKSVLYCIMYDYIF